MIVLGCDHGGFELKQAIMKHLDEAGKEYIDVGSYNTDSIDYPVIAKALCEKITSGEAELGILCCGTGIGMSMAANKVKGIRAACCSELQKNDPAMLVCLGGRVLGAGLALDLVDAFLGAEFEGGRHQRRVDMLEGD